MSPSAPALTAAVLAIGDEVLRGEIVNGNAAYLSARLFDAGFVLREHVVVSDEPGDIRAALRRLGSVVDVLLVTGGLGPTDDDRTVDVVTDLLGVGADVHQPSLDQMKARFARHGFTLTDNNLRQVRVPHGATALANAAGIAPGFQVTVGRAQAFFMPGVPREMNAIFADHVAARLRALITEAGASTAHARTWHVYGMGESHVDQKLTGVIAGIPNATLHFRTEATENHVKIVLRGRTAEQARAELDALDADVRGRLGGAVYGVDDDTFAGSLAQAFRAAHATLACAESCTGGYFGQLVTAEPGASDFFLGGVVSYSNDVKVSVLGVSPATLQQHGAVSEACAREMAQGVRRLTQATVALAITGIAGSDRDWPGQAVVRGPVVQSPVMQSPAGQGSAVAASTAPPEQPSPKPVGTVCFALASTGQPDQAEHIHSETKLFFGGRERIRRAAAFYAMQMARTFLQNQEPVNRGDGTHG